jgi:tetratricopeptide (TPR) repeat protein
LFDKVIALANEKKIARVKQNVRISTPNAEPTASVDEVTKNVVKLDLNQNPVPQKLTSPVEAATESQKNEPTGLVQKTSQDPKVQQDDQKSRTPIQRTNRNQVSKAFEQKQQIDPKNKDSDPETRAAKKALTSSKNNESEIEDTYQEGLLALQNDDWPRAVLAFEKIHAINPEYKDVQNKLADAQFNLTKSNLTQNHAIETEEPNILLMVGFAFSIIFLPMLGVLIFSPTRRARLYLLQRKYEKAANIYEKLLSKNPGRFRLYTRLADIYLHENRHDEKALQVYKTIIRLNLMTKNNEKVKAILAHYYLTQGGSDKETRDTIAKELDAELRQSRSEK